MEIIVNKKAINIPHDTTVIKLLEYINTGSSVAVFVNGKQLLLAQYQSYELQENDNVRVVRPLGGG